jgi:tetratricopeptide (TPR) repeat protein
MAPIANIFVDIGSTMAERFLYSPSLAFTVAFMSGVSLMTGNSAELEISKNKPIFLGIITIVLVLYSIKTINRSQDWKDNLSLFKADVKASPNSAKTHLSLGTAYMLLGQQEKEIAIKENYYNKAIEEFNTALRIYTPYANAWYDLGITKDLLKKDNEAYFAYQKTISIDPTYSKAYNNLGVIDFSKKDYDKALKLFKKAVELDPLYVDALGNIGAVYHSLGNKEEAILWYKKALSINPDQQLFRQDLNLLNSEHQR